MLNNITIDNTNTTYFHYYPPLCNGTGWNEDNDLAAYAQEQTYAYCSSLLGANARFDFTGVAVYMMIPRFQQNENMWFQLDDREFEQVTITSPTGTALRSQVVWSAENLINTHHSVLMYPGTYEGSPGYVSVDAFIYTESDEGPGSASSSSGSSGTNKTAIGVGVGLAIIIIALAGLIAFFFIRNQKEKRQMAQMANKDFTGYTGASQYSGPPAVQPQDSGFRASQMISQSTGGAQSVGFVTHMPQFSGDGPQQQPQTTAPTGPSPGTIYV